MATHSSILAWERPWTEEPDGLQIIFCHKHGVIGISEVIGISPGNLDSSLCFIQPGILHDLHCI